MVKALLMQVDLVFMFNNRFFIMMMTNRNLRILKRPERHKKKDTQIHANSPKVVKKETLDI